MMPLFPRNTAFLLAPSVQTKPARGCQLFLSVGKLWEDASGAPGTPSGGVYMSYRSP
jgi:hypothetical protein